MTSINKTNSIKTIQRNSKRTLWRTRRKVSQLIDTRYEFYKGFTFTQEEPKEYRQKAVLENIVFSAVTPVNNKVKFQSRFNSLVLAAKLHMKTRILEELRIAGSLLESGDGFIVMDPIMHMVAIETDPTIDIRIDVSLDLRVRDNPIYHKGGAYTFKDDDIIIWLY